MFRPGLTTVVLTAFLAVMLSTDRAAAQQAPAPRGLIAFVHEDSGSTDIRQRRMNLWLMNAQNPALRIPLTRFPLSLRMQDPVWTRDFRRILFSGDFNNGGRSIEGMSIYAINANGTGLQVLTGFGVLGQLPGPVGTIRGRVISGVGGQIGTCTISAQGMSQVTTCSDGNFTLNNVPAGSIWVQARASVNDAFGGPGLTLGFQTMTVAPGQVTDVGTIQVKPAFFKSTQPTVSPEGARMVYTSEVRTSSLQPDPITGATRWTPTGGNSLTVRDAAGTRPVSLSSPAFPGGILAQASGADWSPVQDLISAAVSGTGAGQSFVMLMEPAGTNARPIYRPPFNLGESVIRLVTQTRWHPGGRQIAFIVATFALDLSAGWSDLFLINADGTNVRQLTRAAPPQFVGNPTWSPDGQALAFDIQVVPDLIQSSVQQSDIFMIGANGTNFRRLTADGRSFSPAWGLGTPRARLARLPEDGTETTPPLPSAGSTEATAGTWSQAGSLDRVREWGEQMTERGDDTGSVDTADPDS